MREIQLTNGDVAQVDDDSIGILSEHKWNCAIKKLKHGELKYAVAYVRVGTKWGCLLMHRVVAGTPKGICIDHVDGDGLNNQRNNLRPATHKQNMRNRKITPGMTSAYKGVYWAKRDRCWRSCIKSDGKTVHLGSFENEEQAAIKYNEAALRYHGDFALINTLSGQT